MALLTASHLAGQAIVSARVGLVHAMSHALGARLGIAHGTANGILLPHVLRWNGAIPAVAERYALVAQAMGRENALYPPEQAAEAAAGLVTSLLAATGHPVALAQTGVTREDLAPCAEIAMSDLALLTNARPVGSAETIEGLYLEAL
jgi:alcohol dehydrogenase class IV